MLFRSYDRYFQIAKCFRDEDLRADRQPFEQLKDGSVIKTTEMLALNIYNTFYGQSLTGKGVAQAKAVIFFILVAGISIIQLKATRSKEVQQ